VARTGSFGRLPRSVPSLTNTLIAIAHEQQQQEDQNIMEAWQKGGAVDGHKVTDSMVLKHWHDRLKDISKDDPLYDTYRNAVTQYEYSIAESKMTAAYAQVADPKAGDDQKMSAFYMNWSKKIPKDSEFYRVLLRDAGQYIRSAKAKRDALTKQNAEKLYNEQQGRLEKTNELPGQTALRLLSILGQEGSQGRGAVLGETPLGNPHGVVNTTNIADLQLPGVDQMIALLGSVTTGDTERDHNGRLRISPNAQVLYTDENGKPVTGAQITAQFKAMDPAFDGKVNLQYVQGLLTKQRDGLQKRIDLANKTGHISDAMSLTMEQAKVNEYGREVAAWPVASEYNRLHNQLKQTLADADSGKLLPDAAASAILKLRTQIGTLANDKRIAADGHMQSQLRDEANGKMGGLSLAEDLAGTHGGYTESTMGNSDIAYVNDKLDTWKTQKDAVDAGQMVYTQGDYVKGPDGKTTFQASTQGKSVGAAPMAAINNLPGVGKPVPVMVPNGDGGGSTPMYVVPAPIMASVKNLDGTTMPATNANPVGGYIRYKVNGVETTLYSIERGGKTEWTIDPPWDASKVKTSETNGVMTLDLTGGAPTNLPEKAFQDTKGQSNLGNGFSITQATTDAHGVITPGHLEYDPKAATLGTNPPRQYAGHDPYTDSFSASLAAIKSVPDGPAIVKQWTGDSRFHMILEQNARMAAGQTLDATTGQWTGGVPGAYESNLNAMNRDLSYAQTGAPFDSNPANRDAWWRDGTDTKMSGAPAGTVPGPNGTQMPMQTVAPLPTTVIQNSTGSPMKMLGAAFNANGALQFKGKQQDDLGPQIKLGKPLTLPTVAPSATPGPAPTPSPTTTTGAPASTTATAPPPTTSGYPNHEPLSTPHSGYGNHAV
jgi:hypothetical protein